MATNPYAKYDATGELLEQDSDVAEAAAPVVAPEPEPVTEPVTAPAAAPVSENPYAKYAPTGALPGEEAPAMPEEEGGFWSGVADAVGFGDEADDPEWSDYGRLVMSGGAGVAGGTGWLLRKLGEGTQAVGAEWLGDKWIRSGTYIEELTEKASDRWVNDSLDTFGIDGKGLSDKAKKALSVELLGEAELGEKWSKVKLTTAQSLLGTAAGMGAGYGIAGSLMKAGVGTKTAATIGYSAGEALVAAPMAGADAERQIREMPAEELTKTLEFNALMAEGNANDDLSREEQIEYARDVMARAAGGNAAAMTAVSTAVLSAPFSNWLSKTMGGDDVARGMINRAVRGAGEETIQEFAQSGSEAISTNLAIAGQGIERSPFEGALEQAVGGALSGTIMGGAFGAASPRGTDATPVSDQLEGELDVGALADAAAGTQEEGLGPIAQAQLDEFQGDAAAGATAEAFDAAADDVQAAGGDALDQTVAGAQAAAETVAEGDEAAIVARAAELRRQEAQKRVQERVDAEAGVRQAPRQEDMVGGVADATVRAKAMETEQAAREAEAPAQPSPPEDFAPPAPEPEQLRIEPVIEEAQQQEAREQVQAAARAEGEAQAAETVAQAEQRVQEAEEATQRAQKADEQINQLRARRQELGLEPPNPPDDEGPGGGTAVPRTVSEAPPDTAMARAYAEAQRKAGTQIPPEPIQEQADEAATSPRNDLPEPTQAQKEAGNYKKGRIAGRDYGMAGLNIAIENPVGSTRSGTRQDGSTWSVEMKDNYGYIERTSSAEGETEQLDTFVGPNPEADKVFVIDQLDQQTGQFDEHKAMVGYPNRMAAMRAYRRNYQKGWMVGPVTEMNREAFKDWTRTGDVTQPMSPNTPVSSPADVEVALSQDEQIRYARGEVSDLGEAREKKNLKKFRDDMLQKIGRSVEEQKARMDQMDFQHDAGDTVLGSTGQPIKILGRTTERPMQQKAAARRAKMMQEAGYDITEADLMQEQPAYVIEMPDGTQSTMPQWGVKGKFAGPQDVRYASEGMPGITSTFESEARAGAESIQLVDRMGKLIDRIGRGDKVFRDQPYPMTVAEVQEALAPLEKTMGRMAPTILLDPTELSTELYTRMKRDGALDAKGMYDIATDTLYLFADNMLTPQEATRIALHEGLAHKGLRYLFPNKDGRTNPELRTLLDDVYENANPDQIAETMARYNLDPTKAADRRTGAEEHIAKIAEDFTEPGIFQRAVAAVRKALRRMGYVQAWSDNDIRNLLMQTRKALEGTPLESVTLTTQYEVEETGEVVEIEENAAVMARQINKRIDVVEKLRDCL